MLCLKCGNKIRKGHKFCTQCGSKFDFSVLKRKK
ncbi:MAG: zinc-ribbon domain-containing protein [Clostridia bacterium]|nr:zinc-ribbon domain-containing protein [Clostridia bacterium]